MKVIINGENRVLQDGITVKKMLEDINIEEKTMAVAINMQVVKKESWNTHQIKDGDKIECLHFVGGG